MADFCKQCSEDHFGEDFGDLAGFTDEGDVVDKYVHVICEGCGMAYVDHAGVCHSKTCLKRHGLEERDA